MKHCDNYTLETLSCFTDKELPPEICEEISSHLVHCRECRKIIDDYTRISEGFRRKIQTSADSMDSGLLATGVSQRIKQLKTSRFKRWLEFFGGSKIVLQVASIAVIILSTVVYYQMQPGPIDEPSAIVTLVDGNASSVMIFETQEKHHTIIWYTETKVAGDNHG